MKKINLLALILGCSLSITAMADMNQREHHQMAYESGCETCHDQGQDNFPSDQACLQCHDMAEIAQQTARQGHDKMQNPHDSMHYGQEAPCMECHGEHQQKQSICQDCHNFDYPNFRP